MQSQYLDIYLYEPSGAQTTYPQIYINEIDTTYLTQPTTIDKFSFTDLTSYDISYKRQSDIDYTNSTFSMDYLNEEINITLASQQMLINFSTNINITLITSNYTYTHNDISNITLETGKQYPDGLTTILFNPINGTYQQKYQFNLGTSPDTSAYLLRS